MSGDRPASESASTEAQVRRATVALQAIRAARGVVVGTHLGPDADGVGSGLALARGLRGLGVPAWVALEEPLDARNAFLGHGCDDLLRVKEAVFDIEPEVDLAVVVDTGRVAGQTALSELVGRRGCPLVVIDHHLHGAEEGAHRIVVTSSASSAEIVHHVLRTLGAPLDPISAQLLYAATAYDTGSFRFLRDGAATFRLAAELVEAGADPVRAQADLFQHASLDGRRFLARALDRMQVELDGRFAWVALHPSDWQGLGVDREDFRDLIQQMISIRGVLVAATLVAVPEERRVRLSFRARAGLDLERLARRYGGGGHAQACGATVSGPELGPWIAKIRAGVAKVLDGAG